MSTRTSYHTAVKIAAKLNILPYHFLFRIPKSTLSGFRSFRLDTIFGAEFASQIEDNMDILKELLRYKKLTRGLKALLMVKNRIIQIFSHTRFPYKKNLPFFLKKQCVETVLKASKVLGLKKTLRFFSFLSLNTGKFYIWLHQVKHQCRDSIFQLCLRKNPSQISKKEIQTMRQLALNPALKFHSVFSLACHAIREKLLFVSGSSWYKYLKKMEIKRDKAKSRRKKKTTGIRAEKPNQIWHGDITLFKTQDGTTSYIYFIIDNYSRMILNWKVSTIRSAGICLENLKKAHEFFGKGEEITFMTDGGSENVNFLIQRYLEKPSVSITQVIAGKDTPFSNSMIEAFNKTVKYQWLYLHNFKDSHELESKLGGIIREYNEKYYPVSLNGQTPSEIFHQIPLNTKEITEQFQKARLERLKIHQKANCGEC